MRFDPGYVIMGLLVVGLIVLAFFTARREVRCEAAGGIYAKGKGCITKESFP